MQWFSGLKTRYRTFTSMPIVAFAEPGSNWSSQYLVKTVYACEYLHLLGTLKRHHPRADLPTLDEPISNIFIIGVPSSDIMTVTGVTWMYRPANEMLRSV